MSRFGSPWAEIGVGYPSKIGVSQKEPGFRRLYGIQDDAENLSYFHDVRKKLARFFDWGGNVTFHPPHFRMSCPEGFKEVVAEFVS